EWGRVPTAAVGFSLGWNMLACLLGKQGDLCLLDAAVAVSAPLMLEPCSRRLEQGFFRVYQRFLLNLLKLHAWPGTLPVDLAQLESIGRLRDF
ncbi:hydrolase, partial [Erwinia amylovora]|nr:hydrolase [Erwinia amylovora]